MFWNSFKSINAWRTNSHAVFCPIKYRHDKIIAFPSVARENIVQFTGRASGNMYYENIKMRARNSRRYSADVGICDRRPAARGAKKERGIRWDGIENRRMRFVTIFVRHIGASDTTLYIRPRAATSVCRGKVWKIVVFFVREVTPRDFADGTHPGKQTLETILWEIWMRF